MQRYQLSPNFYLDEFMDQRTYRVFGERCQWFIDPKIVIIAQYMRTISGSPVTINNWWHGGTFSYSGYRPRNATVGAEYSQHRFGRAVDLKFRDLEPPEAARLVELHWHNLRAIGLTTMEDIQFTRSWLHLDCRPGTKGHELFIVKP